MRFVVLLQEATKTKGEVGDKKDGFEFNLRVVMGLEDDAELYKAIVVSARTSVFPQAILSYFGHRSATTEAKLPELT
jgi:hypothetical protein